MKPLETPPPPVYTEAGESTSKYLPYNPINVTLSLKYLSLIYDLRKCSFILRKGAKCKLGHKRIEITMNIYAHVLPGMQADAAKKLSAILHI